MLSKQDRSVYPPFNFIFKRIYIQILINEEEKDVSYYCPQGDPYEFENNDLFN